MGAAAGFHLDPSTVCLEQSCCLGGEGKLQGIKKCQGTAQNNIFWVTSGSCRQESSRQKCDKKMQHCEMVFASRMEEEEGYHGQGQCQDTMYWCCWHQLILGFGQII